MAGTVTTSGSDLTGSLKKMVFNWTSDAAGAADYVTEKLTGRLVCVQHIPGTGGNAPTTAYDVVVLNSDGVDVLSATGVNITVPGVRNTTVESLAVPLPTFVNSTLSFAVANAGDTKSGKTVLYFASV